MRGLISLVIVAVLTSCHYSAGPGNSPWVGASVSVPYICGDLNGEYTRALIREVNQCTELCYSDGCATYQIEVAISECTDENIGFRYDRNKSGNLTDHLIPIESRNRIVAQFSLIDCHNGCIALGPEEVVVNVEFDHEFDSGSDRLNQFSLGQVTDLEATKLTVPTRAGKVLAKKIVSYICDAW